MGLSKNIAYRLRTLREAAGLSQQEVADRADLSLSLITKMEQARKADPRASTVIALAAALGVRPGQLIEDLTPPPDGLFPDKKKKKKHKKKDGPAAVAAGAGEPAPADEAESPAPAAPRGATSANGHGKARKKKKKAKGK